MRLPLILSLLSLGISLLGEEPRKELSAEEFLQAARKPSGRECWAKMDGTASHMRKDAEPAEVKISLGILFTPERTIAKLAVNGTESYDIGQSCVPPYSTSVETASLPPDGKAALASFGLRPQDLAMTFIYWSFKEELGRDSFKGQDCRVFILESPDKSETAKVHIGAEYFFPLKVEWTKAGESKPYRTLEVVSFKKERDFWFVSELKLYGPGWITRIKFDDASAGFSKDGVPPGLFSPKPGS